jgi:hypothetical protein
VDTTPRGTGKGGRSPDAKWLQQLHLRLHEELERATWAEGQRDLAEASQSRRDTDRVEDASLAKAAQLPKSPSQTPTATPTFPPTTANHAENAGDVLQGGGGACTRARGNLSPAAAGSNQTLNPRPPSAQQLGHRATPWWPRDAAVA